MSTATTINDSTRGLPAWAADALLGAAVTTTMSMVLSANHGGRNDPDALAYLWAFGLGALMLARRRHPVIVLLITVLGLFAYYAVGYPAVGVAVPIAAALYSAAEFGRVLWAGVAAAVALATSVFFRLAEGQEVSLVVGYELAGHALLMASAIALGDSIRSRRALLQRAEEIVALTSDRAQRESEAKAQSERIAVARDLHDSIGHSTAVISLHADVAREAVGRTDDAAATDALRLIKDTAASTMTELRRTVALLRAPERSPRTVGLAQIRSVIDLGNGLEFTTDIRVPSGLPEVVDTTAFRIIQESVTNIVKHSTATRAHITAGGRGEEFQVTVIDNGRQRESSAVETSGHGIDGMRERATALGGVLDAEPETGGFAVRARIPLGEWS